MIGRVECGEHADTRVLGLPIALRAVLAMQAAGCVRVVLDGARASALATAYARDDRVRVALSTDLTTRADVATCDGEVVDTRAMRGEPGGVRVVVRDAVSRRAAARALLDSLRKSQDGWVSRTLNRPMSLAVTRVLVPTGLRPNTLSVAILGIGLASAWLAAHGHFAWGGLLFHAQSVLDGCDGEISRLTFRGSRTGQWLDTIGDDVTNYGFCLGAAYGLRHAGVATGVCATGVAGVLVGMLASAIEYRYLIAVGSGDLLAYPLGFGNDPAPVANPSRLSRVLGLVRPAFKRDFFVFVTMLATFAGVRATAVMLVLFAIGACATCGAVLASEWRRRG